REAAAVAGLGGLAAFVLREALTSGLVATGRFNDIAAQFAAWRQWGFGELAAGRFPLWNPYAFGGHPFHGSFEPGLLYPPNWLHLALSNEAALNAVLLLHVWLAGALTYAWARRRGASAAGAFAGGAAFMFCGPLFLRLYAGHLPYLCSAAWLPGLLLCVDELRRAPSARWAAAAAAMAAMTVLAGNPQAAWLAALSTALYALLDLPSRKRRLAYAAALAGAALAGAALSAAQWLPGLEAASESTRWGGLAPAEAASFALDLGDLLSLAAPSTLSSGLRDAGSGFYWESCLHLGAAALGLGLWAGLKRDGRAALAAAAVLLLLAFGPGAPVIGRAFAALPFASVFRASGRLALPACAFLALLCALGHDGLAPRLGRWRAALMPLIVLESLFFAGLNVAAEPVRREFPVEWSAALAGLRPGERVIFDMRTDPDAGLVLDAPEVWGYGQLVPRRWAELLFASQGQPPDSAGASLIIRRDHRLLRLLRARAVLRRGSPPVKPLAEPLPRLLLVRSWRLSAGRDETLAALLDPAFDPAKTVLLETAPEPEPDPVGRGGSARVVKEDSDSLELEAELDSPAILLLADSYAPGWRAEALEGSSQARYRVLPADHALRAIPLGAGRHRLVLRYAPGSWAAGAAVSLASWAALAAWAVLL
ncbi:MAG: hypothetical protein NUW21_11315, partial [Elusimicrobia bacterium]|nr:hypothetical protein [Elusimicrobiota bacterium]